MDHVALMMAVGAPDEAYSRERLAPRAIELLNTAAVDAVLVSQGKTVAKIISEAQVGGSTWTRYSPDTLRYVIAHAESVAQGVAARVCDYSLVHARIGAALASIIRVMAMANWSPEHAHEVADVYLVSFPADRLVHLHGALLALAATARAAAADDAA